TNRSVAGECALSPAMPHKPAIAWRRRRAAIRRWSRWHHATELRSGGRTAHNVRSWPSRPRPRGFAVRAARRAIALREAHWHVLLLPRPSFGPSDAAAPETSPAADRTAPWFWCARWWHGPWRRWHRPHRPRAP